MRNPNNSERRALSEACRRHNSERRSVRTVLTSAFSVLTSAFSGPSLAVLLSFASAGFAASPADSLQGAWRTTIARADSLYHRQRYEPALIAYRQANRLLPDEPGARVGIGWTFLQLGYFYEAETTLRAVLGHNPDRALAREGLKRIPPRYRFAVTLSRTEGFGSGAFHNTSAFLKLSRHDQTALTLGFQNVVRDSDNGFNAGGVLYRQLAFPWSARLDFYGLSAFNKPRYWQVVYAPSVARVINTTTVRLTLVGWDNMPFFGAQIEAVQRLPAHLQIGMSPAVNRAYGRFGWLAPLDVAYSPFSWFDAHAGAGVGSIVHHADFAVPTFYNRAERLTGQFKVGADFVVGRRFRIKTYLAGERYDTGLRLLLPSLTLTAGF